MQCPGDADPTRFPGAALPSIEGARAAEAGCRHRCTPAHRRQPASTPSAFGVPRHLPIGSAGHPIRRGRPQPGASPAWFDLIYPRARHRRNHHHRAGPGWRDQRKTLSEVVTSLRADDGVLVEAVTHGGDTEPHGAGGGCDAAGACFAGSPVMIGGGEGIHLLHTRSSS